MAKNRFKTLRNVLQGNTAKYKIPTERPTMRLQRQAFQSYYKAASSIYQSQLRGTTDRLERIKDYDEMDLVPEISKSLDIFADDALTYDENGQMLKIISDDNKLVSELHELYYEILDIDYHLWHWTRNMCKYGDQFNLIDVVDKQGVVGVLELPVAEMEREEGFDNDPNSLRFKWLSAQGPTDYFENYQISHMRILGDDRYLPYGRSMLDSGRKIYKQLIMAEDSMLIYRITRAPERRVFYVDVANIPPKDVDVYMKQARDAMRRTPQIKKQDTGTFDLRYNPESILEDFFIPVRGDRSSRIETLPGGENASAIEDVEYLQNKLFIALGVPKSYLTAEEDLSGKSTLAQEDIKFARTIQRVQKIIVSELAKIGLIHLFLRGYDEQDIYNFDLKLTNPSSVTELMHLELIERRFSLAEQMAESKLVHNEYIQKTILKMTDKEIAENKLKQVEDAKDRLQLEKIETEGGEFGEDADDDFVPYGNEAAENKDYTEIEKGNHKDSFPYDPTGTKRLKGVPDQEAATEDEEPEPQQHTSTIDKVLNMDDFDDDNDGMFIVSKKKKKNSDPFSKTISDVKKHDRSMSKVLSRLGEHKKEEKIATYVIKAN